MRENIVEDNIFLTYIPSNLVLWEIKRDTFKFSRALELYCSLVGKDNKLKDMVNEGPSELDPDATLGQEVLMREVQGANLETVSQYTVNYFVYLDFCLFVFLLCLS